MTRTPGESFADRHWPGADARAQAERVVRRIQDRICAGVMEVEAHASLSSSSSPSPGFREDRWLRPGGNEGGGITRVLQDGHVFEKAGVNVSVVSGTVRSRTVLVLWRSNSHAWPCLVARTGRPGHAGRPCQAAGDDGALRASLEQCHVANR